MMVHLNIMSGELLSMYNLKSIKNVEMQIYASGIFYDLVIVIVIVLCGLI